MVLNMDIATARQKINDLQNKDEKEVGNLFLDLGFELIDCRAKINNKRGQPVGEIDLIYKFKDYVFLLEVTGEKRGISTKIDHFFSRWTDRKNVDYIFLKYPLPRKRTVKIFFDLARERAKKPLASIEHHLRDDDLFNKILYKDDLRYFQDTYKIAGKWVRNDLLSFLEIPRAKTSKEIDAIQFYIAGKPAFAFVEKVNFLLDSCYVFRRLKNDKGYQRALKPGQIGDIEESIKKRKILAFPNSILINCQAKLTNKIEPPEKCPKHVEISLPSSYCSFRVIDGQHRLLGFAKLPERVQEEYNLLVIAFHDLNKKEEVLTFITINSKQKKIDPNLILLLKSDWDWEVGSKEFTEKKAVEVIKRLNEKGTLKGKIYLGVATEKRGKKITLTTLVSSTTKNNLIGGRLHLYQKDTNDVETPYENIKHIFELIDRYLKKYSFGSSDPFFVQNKGLRILFRFAQLFERNKRCGNISISLDVAFEKISKVVTPKFRGQLDDYYGEGGANRATHALVDLLKTENDEFKDFEDNLRHLKV